MNSVPIGGSVAFLVGVKAQLGKRSGNEGNASPAIVACVIATGSSVVNVNLVSLAQQFLTPELIAKIASALGVDRSLIGKAVTALIPTLLRSLANVASNQVGAKKLADVIGQQDPGILDRLASAIGGSGQQALTDGGINSLNSILGGSTVRDIATALGKFTGMGQSPTWSLIGMLAPAILGLLGKQKTEQGLDASGLANLLAAQKGNVSAAMPSDFADRLSSAGVPGFAAATTKPAQRVQAAFDETARAAKSASFPGWLGWALGLLVIALIAWWLFADRTADVVDQTAMPEQAVEDLTVDGVDLRSSVQTTIGNLKTTLRGISDVASADAALPQLETAAAELGKVAKLSSNLPAMGKSALATLVTTARPAIEELFIKVLAIPGVDAVAKPAIETLRAKLDALSEA